MHLLETFGYNRFQKTYISINSTQGYLSESDFEGTVHMGRSIALEIGKSFSNTDYKTGIYCYFVLIIIEQ